MKITYQNDRQPGYGQFNLSQTSYDAGEISFMLERASDRKCLSLAGWQEADIALKPDSYHWLDDDLYIKVGPKVVDNLDMQEAYRFTLLTAGGGRHSAVLKVPGIVYSPLSGGQGITPQKTEQPEPEADLPAKAPVIAEPIPVEQDAEEEVKPPPAMNLGMPEMTKGNKRNLKILAGSLALFVTILLAVIISVYNSYKSPQAETPPLQQAYQHLNLENTTAQSSLELALKLAKDQSDEAKDAAFLLFEDAAEKGSVQAMMQMAGYYDPLDEAPNGSIIKEAEQALKWYEAALKGGDKTAEAKIQALKTWMEENATS